MDTATLEPVARSRSSSRERFVGLTIAAHPDAARVGERALLPSLYTDRRQAIGRGEPAFGPVSAEAGAPLGDRYVSRRPLMLRRDAHGRLEIDASECGSAVRVDGEALVGAVTVDGPAIDRGVVIMLARRVVLLLHRFSIADDVAPVAPGLIGHSDAVVALRAEIERVADLDIPVLIRGETGTGKELVAQAIHAASRRAAGPCRALNMGAVPAATAAAELFGHARGAYTGADRARAGLFREADGGTVFLDEIGEASSEVQVLLLRVLETGEVRGLGEGAGKPVDVRVVAATDADLDGAIEAGRFRAPLFHRLAGYIIRLPPLRARRDDIGRLAVHFLREMLAEAGEPAWLDGSGDRERPWLSAWVVERLLRHDWPGNVRALRNVARQLVVASRGEDELRAGPALEAALGELSIDPEDATAPAPAKGSSVDDVMLVAALRRHGWQIHAAARSLGMSRQALYRRIDRCPVIRKANEVPRAEIEQALVEAGGRVDRAAKQLEVSPRGLRLRMTELGMG